MRSQAAPLIQNTNELDARTSQDHRAIQDTDTRAQQGIAGAQAAANTADQHATAAGQSAAIRHRVLRRMPITASTRSAVSLRGSIRTSHLSDASVTFAFDKAALTPADKKQLDQVASSLQTTRHYIVELTGGTDSTGDAQYNYTLSQRRADAVAQYLQTKYSIAPHKFYLVGIGKDQEVATNRTAAGRKQNRRVAVRVLSNMQEEGATASSAPVSVAKPS